MPEASSLRERIGFAFDNPCGRDAAALIDYIEHSTVTLIVPAGN